MRWLVVGGGLMLVLACGGVDIPVEPVPEAATPAPVVRTPAKERKEAGGDCEAYCGKFETCAHVEGWDYDDAECAKACWRLAADSDGEDTIRCFLATDGCMDAIGCIAGGG